MKNTIFILLGLFITFVSCKKEDFNPEPNNTIEENLNGVWIEGEWQTMTTSGADTTWTYDEYVGDGYNNGVTTVIVNGTGYLTNDTINVDGVNYVVSDYETDQADPMWRYWVEIRIVSPFEGCKYYLELFKRQND